MSNVINRPKWLLFLLLTSVILLSNYTLYHTQFYNPIPKGAVLGSLFDFIIIIPLLTYFIIIRKRYSLKYLGAIIFAGFATAYVIIPNQHLSDYPFLPYLLIISDLLLLALEAYIAYKVLTKLPSLAREYRKLSLGNSFVLSNAKMAVELKFPDNKIVPILVTEFALFNYSLFSWKKKAVITNGTEFTYHKKTSGLAHYIMLIHATAIESIGLHYLLHSWNVWISYILLLLNLYAILYFLAEIHAIRLTPFVLSETHLFLQTGFAKSMNLPLNKIKEINYFDGPERFSRKELNEIYDARVPDMTSGKPQFEILLHEPHTLHMLYGLKRKVSRIVLNVDDSHKFFNEISPLIK
ncbi:hypothetical protein [Mesobacillus foraminis]|uniref:hypothetical protein n=1 Tax=Mesobacillus foraminis TaxID=279826 RepID=UPI000EF521C5|nr:hypothetical protein [Mesobacillus foraminis]